MLRKLLCIVPLSLAMQLAFTECSDTKIEQDPEPNWETAMYSCPVSIETTKGKHSLSRFGVAKIKNDVQYELAPEPRKHVYFRQLEPYNVFLVCKYGQEIEILVHAKDAVACGGNGEPGHLVCWTTDPYAGKKSLFCAAEAAAEAAAPSQKK